MAETSAFVNGVSAMLKYIDKDKVKRYGKKSISIATATIMLMANMQLGETWPVFRDVSKKIIAHAESTYEYNATTKVATIHSWEDLVEYSGLYYTDSNDHTEDTIYIDYTGNTTAAFTGFQSIGSDTKPFKGKILFETASASNFNISEPLFGTVYDSVKIVRLNNDVEENTSITISKSGSNQYDPLFAVKVIHDDTPANEITRIEDAPGWSVTSAPFSWGDNNDTFSNAGFIEAIDANAFVDITIINNAYYGTEGAIIENDDDVGTICGKLGGSAVLKANYSGTNVDYTLESNAGHAGGMVGSMASGSTLDLTISSNPQTTASAYVKTSYSGKYAGGLVGYNNGGEVTLTCGSSYAINQMICGMAGEGGIYGYYYTSDPSAELDVSDYSVACLLNTLSSGVGNAGALIGECSNAGSLTIKGDSSDPTSVESTLNTLGDSLAYTKSETYGGLIGKYSANSTLTNTLKIQDISVSVNNTFSASKYGGCIAVSDGLAYVEFDNISIDSTGHGGEDVKFGGLIDEADNSYVYAKNITVGSSDAKISSFAGGGLISSLNYGVLRMSDSIDLQYAEPTAAAANGQIVATRNHALVYADAGWTYLRSNIKVDNVGSWGDVIVFNTLASDSASGGKLLKANVLTENPNHTISITAPASNTITSAEDFAKISILRQIDIGNAASKNRILSGTNIAASTVLSSSGTIYLKDTGLRGITRDNGSTNVEYSGSTFDGNSGTIVLDIQNVGGKPVYYHSLNGLFGLSSGTEFKNVTFDGSISIDGAVDNIYVGTAAATANGNLNLTSCNTASTLDISIGGEKAGYAGRMIGYATTTIGNITVSGGTYDGTLSITNHKGGTRLGGVIGCIAHNTNAAVTWDFTGVTLKGTIQNTSTTAANNDTDQKFGGLVASIGSYTPDGTTKDLRSMTLDVDIDGLQITGKTKGNMGGLLGYSWPNTNVTVTDVSLLNAPTITLNEAGHVSGLVAFASGHWTFTKLDMSNLKVVAATAKSIGFIVNKGYTTAQTSGIYLELDPSVYTLSLATGSSLPDQTDASKFVYDEVCAYSSKDGIMKNGQGIISIKSDGGLKMESSATPSLSYTAKTAKGQNKEYENPNTRYYYNLDAIDDDNTESGLSAPQKLLRWGVQQYACTNIKPYFASSFTTSTTVGTTTTISHAIPTGNYNMKGYSWYPISVSDSVTVAGTFAFYNEEFEKCETATGGKSNTQFGPNLATQHYMMQNGLFYNVSSSMTIGAITLQGTIGAVDTSGTGALIYGEVSGADADHITTISSENGSISLDGIKVHNYSTKSSSYAPLLINKSTSGYVTFYINDVSTTATYLGSSYLSSGKNKYVATSLIGTLGSSSAKYVNVTFKDIKLDGRTSGKLSSAIADTVYNTKNSIFSRATLLESFLYDSDSSGVYNYTYDDDWGSGNRKVTYGKEVGYIAGTPNSSDTNQYPNEERQYSGTPRNYTTYTSDSSVTGNALAQNFRDNFQPYVKTVKKSEKKYQLQVNHGAASLTGCGTYNDPYIIASADDLESISRMIRGTFNGDDTVCIPYDGLYATWCKTKATATTSSDHVGYKYSASLGAFQKIGDTSTTLDKLSIQKHLAGSYYKVDLPEGTTSITVSNETYFQGLGGSSSDIMFRGVIVGDSATTYEIINQTQYPLIAYSNGSVVKNLKVTVDKSFKKTGTKNAFPNNNAYGAVIGQIHGGDNIIDKVTVNFGSSLITLDGDYAQLVPTGGYVGVVINGGLIFKNMSTIANVSTSKLLAANVTKGDSKPAVAAVADMTATSSTHETTNDLWLYVNPYVGRVINGYAVNEAGAYHAREANQTLKNGTKHYSITDIGENTKLSISSSKITIPDSQSFFIMSLIVNSGMGMKASAAATGTYTLGYYNGYSTTRHANYSDVGTNSAQSSCTDYSKDDTYTSAKWDRYWANLSNNNDKKPDTPYLVVNYTTGSKADNYPAKALGGASSAWAIDLTTDVTYTLPDGYKGIGNIFNNNNALRLSVSSFDGKACTIEQNTSYLHYNSNDAYPPVQGPGDTKYLQPDLGLGLFNCQTYHNATTKPQYSNFTLSGKVRSDVIDNTTGTHISYTITNTIKTSVLSAGMLFGSLNGATQITNVTLLNVDVRTAKYSGGMIGVGPNGTAYDIDIIQESNYNSNSSGITVRGVGGAGGLIGRWQSGKPTIDYNGHVFGLTAVYSDIQESNNTDQYKYGVGGIIGVCRAGGGSDNGTPAGDGTIQNITIGTKTSSTKITVGCSVDDCGVNAGGLMGTLNRCSPKITNCKLYNIDVNSDGSTTYAGGTVGYVTTYCEVEVENTEIYTNATAQAKIVGNGYCGGILGQSPKQSGDGTLTFTLLNSSIDGYIIEGKTVGGIVGERNSWRTTKTYNNVAHPNGFDMNIKNFEIKNCTVTGKGDGNIAGGLIGNLITPIKGYNIHATNLSVSGATQGYIIGKTDDNDKGLIKLVAFSRQESRNNQTMLARIVGTHTGSYDYGNGGYVVFSDYTGVDTNHSFSGINATSNITSCNTPYVHVNPKATLEGTGNSEIFLTGDGVSPLTQVNGGYASAALKGINDDAQAGKPNYILPVSGYNASDLTTYKANMQALYNTYISRQSTFAIEASDKLTGVSGYQFPVLVLDISNAKQSTEYINNYIHLMTNTSSSVFSNFANDETEKYQVVLTKFKVNVTTDENNVKHGSLVPVANVEGCFKKTEGKFRMDPADTDTIAQDAQFTLMDIQFFDPTDTTKIAYHLYIPIYCRKLLEYDFRVELKSGTDYERTDDVTDIRAAGNNGTPENLLIENIGVPITMEFAYTYKRTLKEWQDALEGGDTLLTPYSPRKLEFKNSTYVATGGTISSFPSATKMVLVDVNRDSKAYYLNGLTSTSFSEPDSNSISYLNLNSFTASDGTTAFTPPSFCDLMIVTVVQDDEGKFVATGSTGITGEVAAGGTPAVKANSGTYNEKGFRLAEDADTDATRYSVTLAFPTGVTELTEHYFLTIYTPSPDYDDDSRAKPVYHYEIGTKSTLTDDSKPYPSKVTTACNQRSDLYLGEIYNNTVEIVNLSDPQMITKDNNSITAQVKATISLTDAGKNNVLTNLDKAALYQSFLIKMNKFNTTLSKSEVGILAEHISVSPSDGKIGYEGSLSNAEMTWSGNSNYIEVKSNQPLSGIIQTNSSNNRDTIISATVAMTFDPETDDISNQFYGQPTAAEKGTHIMAYSNIASSNSQTAYSKVYDKVEDSKIYFTADTQEAVLSYEAVTVAGKGQLPQLGINRKDSNEAATSIIKTQGNYGIGNCLTAANECDYVKCKISLTRKENDGSYTAPLVLSDYISGVSFVPTPVSTSNGNAATEWIYVFDKDDLTLANNVYSIPINLTIISGSDFETGEDSNGDKRQYSNYKIKLEVSMQDSSATNDTDKTGTWATDYLIYTHAKLYTGRVEPVAATP